MRGRWIDLFGAAVAVLCLCSTGCGGGSSTTLLLVATTSLPNGTVGTPYTPALQATGGTPGYSWAQTSGRAMPNGVTLSSAGQFSGTPTVPGTFGPYVFKVTDSASTSATAMSASMSITIGAATLSVTTGSLPGGTIGAAYAATLTAAGGVAPYTWVQTSGGALPPGILDVTSAGVLAGTPTTPGSYGPYVFTVTDSKGGTAVSAGLTIAITGTAASKCTPLGNEAVLTSATPYAFLVKGSDAKGNPIDIAGSFTPNGSGGITSAALDDNGYSSPPQQIPVDVAGSSYALGTATLGCLSLAFSNPASVGIAGVTFSFSLASLDGNGVYHTGRIIESDNLNGTGTNASGSMHVQTASQFALSALQSRYAFGVDGWVVAAGNSGLSRTTLAGSFSNTNGALSAGYADLNEGGTASGELTAGGGQLGAVDASSGRGTGNFAILTGSGSNYTFNFTFYVINGSALYLISANSPVGVGAPALLGGRALVSNAQFAPGALDGYYAMASEGLDVTVNSGRGRNVVEVATVNATSSGTIPTTTFYINDAGVYTTRLFTNGTYVLEAASGRASLTTANNTPLPVVYLTANSKLDDEVAGFVVGNDATSQSGIMVSQSASVPNYTLASVTGNYASSTAEDVDGTNGAFLGAFTFNGTGAYSVVSQTTGSVANTPKGGAMAINADGSGSLDGGEFPFVTNGSVLFAIPDSGDPLLFVLSTGVY
jgi:hypothetical protein